MDGKRVIFIDVDDTLIRSVGTKQIPMPASADYVRRMHAAGHTLYCWTRGGGDYARDVAQSLGIADCFVAFLPKPDVVLDDQGQQLLDHCDCILPGNASNH
ncbi:MAG: hydrolase [Fuerstiella sp.]|nr:hydrolase [Fuerstiella sp.]MCP4859579.1 hydrolase [Fuerstiella sp.]